MSGTMQYIVGAETSGDYKKFSSTSAESKNRLTFGIARRVQIVLSMLALIVAVSGCGPDSPSPTPHGGTASRALWIANRGSQTVVEIVGRFLSTAGVSIPAVAASNSSADLNGPLGIAFDSSNNQWVGNRDVEESLD
jgi:hypothetical protein